MSTYREIVYMCIDQLKLLSDDTYYTEDHFLYLINKTRAYLLKQQYNKVKTDVSQSNYQTIELELEKITLGAEVPCALESDYLKSTTTVPNIMSLGTPKVMTGNFYKGSITYVPMERMKYTGYNKYLKNIMYASISPDEYLYITPAKENITKVYLSAVFEDPTLGIPDDADIMDENFPLEESLIPAVIDTVVKTLYGYSYRPQDTLNNANDDLSDMMSFIRQNMKSNLTKQMENGV